MGRADTDTPPVLRFSSESHAVELTEWPPDWVDLNDHQLVKLLRSAESLQERRREAPPRRRHDDPPANA